MKPGESAAGPEDNLEVNGSELLEAQPTPNCRTRCDRQTPHSARSIHLCRSPYAMFFAGILVMLVVVLSFYQITDYDVWLHLNIGRWIVEHHSLPWNDPFSHTATGASEPMQEWLAETCYYLCYLAFGLIGLEVVKCLIFITAFLFNYELMLRLGALPLPAVALLFLCLAGARRSLLERPTAISFVLVAALLLLLDASSLSRRLVGGISLLMLLWANMHPGVLYGLALIYAATAEAAVDSWLPGRKAVQGNAGGPAHCLRNYIALSALSSVAVLCTPGFYKPLAYSYLMKRSGMLETLGTEEWLRPDFTPHFAIFWLLLAVSAAIIIVRFRTIPLRYALFALFTGYLAVSARRCVLFFLPIAALAAAPEISRWYRALLKPLPHWRFRVYLESSVTIMLLLFAIRVVQTGEVLYRFGWGVNSNAVPVDLPAFIERCGLSGNAYNSYSIGGFLSFYGHERLKIFQDGRNLVFREVYAQLRNPAMKIETLFTELHPVDLAFVNYQPRDSARVIGYFTNNPEWALVWWDDVTMLFLRRIERFAAVIHEHEYRAVNALEPEQLNSPELLERYSAELDRAEREAPSSCRVHFYRGRLLLNASRFEQALEEFRLAAPKYRQTADFYVQRGLCLMGLGRLPEALQSVAAALSYNDKEVQAYVVGAAIRMKSGRPELAVQALRRALQLQPGDEQLQAMLREAEAATTR